MKKESYKKKIEELYQEFDTTIEGLTEEEALNRLAKNGENKLKEPKKKSNILMFLEQFKDLMTILLIGAAIISGIISIIKHESFADSIIILGIVIINAIMSFIQEKKASKAILELNKMFVNKIYVIRDGRRKLIDVKNIVVGDILEIEAGNYIAADARIIEEDYLEVDESTLTGESLGVRKCNKVFLEKRELYERTNMVFAGCNVLKGHALVLVCATGMDTELGKVAKSISEDKEELTPLQIKINKLGQLLTILILSIVLIMFVIGVLLGNDLLEVLMLSISLAVAAIPEGLSSVITIILALGMSDMAKKKVIIKKINSVETLGSVDIICSDKTGTITQNKMAVKKIFVNDFIYNEEDTYDAPMFLLCAYCCHDVKKDNEVFLGDETEVAIVKYLENHDINFHEVTRIKEIPFDSDRKLMSTINEWKNEKYVFTKGSTEEVIRHCTKYVNGEKIEEITEEYLDNILKLEKELSLESYRLIAFAYSKDLENLEQDMTFLGFMALVDPPRPLVADAINWCYHAGIKPVMITGDSINTAIAIAKDVGIIDNDDKAILGKDLECMNEEEQEKAVLNYQVYARISPSTKLLIVKKLMDLGYVVAMTGDGVNDAPAISKASIGIGMGQMGTEVVKNVADCVLVDDSFITIVDGVKNGRRINENIKKVILYLLGGNIIEVILVFVSLLLNVTMFNTIQLLWINLLTDSIPAIMLAFEKGDENIYKKQSKNKENFLTPFLIAKIFLQASFKAVLMLFLFIYFVSVSNVEVASSLLFIFLIWHELLFAYSCKDLKKSIINKRFFDNKYLNLGVLGILMLQLIVLSTGFAKYFIVSGLQIKYLIIVFVVLGIMFICGELLKPFYVKHFDD